MQTLVGACMMKMGIVVLAFKTPAFPILRAERWVNARFGRYSAKPC